MKKDKLQVECSKCSIMKSCPIEKYSYQFPDIFLKTADADKCPLVTSIFKDKKID